MLQGGGTCMCQVCHQHSHEAWSGQLLQSMEGLQVCELVDGCLQGQRRRMRAGLLYVSCYMYQLHVAPCHPAACLFQSSQVIPAADPPSLPCQAREAELEQWEQDVAVARSEGQFFKSLYQVRPLSQGPVS